MILIYYNNATYIANYIIGDKPTRVFHLNWVADIQRTPVTRTQILGDQCLQLGYAPRLTVGFRQRHLVNESI